MLLSVIANTLRTLPPAAAFPVTARLAAVPKRLRLTERDRAALQSATSWNWGPEGRHVAWRWGSGPLVLLVHGWGGRAAQMAPLAQQLAAAGFSVLAPDISGNGDSPGARIRFRQFIDDIGLICRQVGEPLFAMIGHSAGGMTMMAARAKHGVRAERYVCMNAPRAPYPPLRTLRKLLNPRDAVLARCRQHFSAQFDAPAEVLESGELYRYRGQGRLLLINDRDDIEVDASDAELIAKVWPGAERMTTEGLGHHRVLWNEAVQREVVEFLAKP